MSKKKNSLANPITLDAFGDDEKTIEVIIETAKGSRNKFSYDEKLRIFRLKRVLPEGMNFPFDFGFVPSTLAEDGDPVDVLVLMDEAACTGCLVPCRVIGAILGEEKAHGEKRRNDRLLAIAVPSHTHSDVKSIEQLNHNLLREIEAFFVNYHKEYGSQFKVLGHSGPGQAMKLLQAGIKRRKAA